MGEIKWLKKPEKHDYEAAESYLTLIFEEHVVNRYIEQLKQSIDTQFKAKDIFRASNLSLLGVSNSHVKKNLKKIKNNQALSPILLVRDAEHGKVIIADGYHRMCAIYEVDEDAWIPCRIV